MNADLSLLELFALAYLALVLVKTILMYGNIDAMCAAYYRKRRDSYPLLRVLVAIALIPFVVFFFIPVLLRDEGFKFFFVYSKKKAMRDLASGL